MTDFIKSLTPVQRKQLRDIEEENDKRMLITEEATLSSFGFTDNYNKNNYPTKTSITPGSSTTIKS